MTTEGGFMTAEGGTVTLGGGSMTSEGGTLDFRGRHDIFLGRAYVIRGYIMTRYYNMGVRNDLQAPKTTANIIKTIEN